MTETVTLNTTDGTVLRYELASSVATYLPEECWSVPGAVAVQGFSSATCASARIPGVTVLKCDQAF